MKEDLLKYLELQKRLYHFEAIEKLGEVRASILYRFFSTLFVFMFLMFLGIGAALYLNYLLNSGYLGFTMVTGFYLLILLFILVFKKQIKKQMFLNFIDRNIPS